MLFSEKRSSVIFENDNEPTSVDDKTKEEQQQTSNDKHHESQEQPVAHRLGKKAKITFKRVFSSPSRKNSGETIEMKTCQVDNYNNSLYNRRKSEQLGRSCEVEDRLKKRRMTLEFEPENLRRVKVQSSKRRFSSCNVLKDNLEDSQKTSTNGIFIKNRRTSISKQFLPPVNVSVAQNTSKSLYNPSTLSRKRRIKSNGFLDDNEKRRGASEEYRCNEVRVTNGGKQPNNSQVKKKSSQSNNTSSCHSGTTNATPEPSPKGASTILKTLNAAKLSESAIVGSERASRSQQNTPKLNARELNAAPSSRAPIRIPYRRRVAVSFSNYNSASPVILSKFKPNKEFDSTF